MKKIFLIIACALIGFSVNAQTAKEKSKSTWKTLSKVTYKQKFDEMMGIDVNLPIFGKGILALAGKEIYVKGYMIPVDGYKEQKHFMFSAYPYSMCYFCGGAGPETVMEVYAKKGVKYTAQPIIIKGMLQLNSSDPNQLMYSLTNVEEVSR